ncbi:hypothetical protein VZT92_001340 [Zoarces viviparus]|uniref:Ig-like domain-containing protein n=1 Tax=Zoarces viviparus TaxID=48416 RepID=A0AAW1G3K9_ZOAVI
MEKLTGLCVLLAALSLAVTEDKFVKEGDTLTLDVSPPYPEPIKNILWKFNGDLLAEWIKDLVDVEFYRSFKARSTLDTKNGRLVVDRMSQADRGVYSVEINSNLQSVSYTVKVIKSVPQPEAVLKPLICTHESKECSVSCDGDTTGAEPITYSWKTGAKDWKPLEKSIGINEIKNAYDKNFTCRMTNPVSEKVSGTISNPFYQRDQPEPGSALGIVLGVIFSILALVVVVGVWMWKVEKCPFQNRGSHRTDTGDGTRDKETDQPVRSRLNVEENL